MADRIQHLSPRRGRKPIYPWSEWMDGSAWRVRQGVDFAVTPRNMASIIRDRAARTGCQVTALVEEDYVEFQFTVAPGEERAA